MDFMSIASRTMYIGNKVLSGREYCGLNLAQRLTFSDLRVLKDLKILIVENDSLRF